MQVTNTLSEGLKREFNVVLAAQDLAERLTTELVSMKDKVRINGFRPGKVPLEHLRRMYGRQVMGDVVQNLVNETNRKLIEENGIKLAVEPKIVFPEDQTVIEAAIAGTGGLEFQIQLEILPKIDIKDFSGIALNRQVASVEEKSVDETLAGMAAQSRPFSPRKEGKKAKTGDRVTIDFVGMIDGVPFEGGTGTDVPVEIGSGQFIPGFEEQLVGVVAGETLIIKATFPVEYQAAHLAGKDATFNTTVKIVEEPGEAVIDDDFAKNFGMESLEKMKDAIRANVAREYEVVARRKTKRELLDALDAQYEFDLPPSLVEQEFNGIWSQVTNDLQQAGKSFADEDTTEEAAREEYLGIAKRRVRLGLVLGEIGETAKVVVTEEEISQGVMERARQFPGQEKMVWDFYRQNPQAIAEIRAPLFEEKVVDYILAGAKITDHTVSADVLLKEDDADNSKPKSKAKAKKSAKDEGEASDDKPKAKAAPKAKAKKAADGE
jgi:trigger factor